MLEGGLGRYADWRWAFLEIALVRADATEQDFQAYRSATLSMDFKVVDATAGAIDFGTYANGVGAQRSQPLPQWCQVTGKPSKSLSMILFWEVLS